MEISYKILECGHDTTEKSGDRTWFAKLAWKSTARTGEPVGSGEFYWPKADSDHVAGTAKEAIEGAENQLHRTFGVLTNYVMIE